MTPQERLKIFNEERRTQGRTPEERRRIFFEEQSKGRGQQPAQDSFSERAYDAIARGGGTLARGVRNVAALTAAGGVPGADVALNKIDAFINERDAELAARRANRPAGGLATRAAETAIEAAPVVAAGALLTPTGAGLPAAMAAGGTFGAVTADWRNPREAAIQTAIGAAAPPAAKLIGAGVRAGAEGVKRLLGRGAEQIVEAEIAPAATRQLQQAAREIPPVTGESAPVSAPAAPAGNALQSAFQKLGTDNVDEIGNVIANANRRYRQSSTPEQIQSSVDDFNRINQLTLDEQRALSQVLPARTVSPVVPNYGGKGGYSRDVSDISASEVDAQLDANLRSLEEFFGAQGGATASRATAQQAAMRGPATAAALDLPPLEVEEVAPSFGVKMAPELAYKETVGPRLGGAVDPFNAAISEAVEQAPRTIGQRVRDEIAAIYQLPWTLKSSLDISAPFRQGALLTVPPTQWGRAGRAWLRMFQSFKTKNYDKITQEIGNHADAPVAKDSGLYLSTQVSEGLRKTEEAFMSKYAGKIPLVKQSEQAYKTYLDSLRMDTFAKYKRVIDKSGLSPEQAQNAYKAAATWVNYATGRGSFGQTIDKAMPALNAVLFSPRYVASRLNVLNPAYYAKNAATPAGRAVLKQQVSELFQYAGMVAATMKLAQAAGADVSLNPNSPDFLKIRFGSWRYDTLAGLQQVMRLIYRTGADINRNIRGEKTPKGEGAADIGLRFLRSKLAPPPAVFVDFLTRRTFLGKEPTAGQAVKDLIAPIQWADFVEAYQKEGWGGVGMATPGLVGFGAQRYEQTPQDAAIEKAQPLFSELQRLNKKVSELRRRDNEADGDYNTRVRMFSDNYSQYGLRLVASPRFGAAPDNIKALALDRLNEQAKKLTTQEFAFPALTLDANELMDAAENSKRNPARK